MAALESTKFVTFALPPSKPLFCNSNTPWPAKTSRSLNTSGSQKIHRPAATFSRSGCQAEAGRNTAARAKDDDLLPLEELFRTALRPKISTKASKTESTLQRLEQPALNEAGLQVDQTQSGLGGRQGDSRDQPMILDDDDPDEAGSEDEAEGASDVNTVCIERDASLHNTLVTSEPALGLAKSIDASGPWYDVEDGCYINEPALRLGSCKQGVPSAPAQDQPQILPRSSTPLQDQINQQDINDITQSMSMESAPHSLPKPSDNGDDGWTDDSMAELEKELGLALEDQVKSSSASAPTSPSPLLVEAPQGEIQSRERSETSGSRPEELRDACRHGTPAQGLELEQQETWVVIETLRGRELGEEELVGEAGEVEMQQQEELAGQKKELRRPALGDQQGLVELDDTDDPMDKEATEALPATQLEIDKHRF